MIELDIIEKSEVPAEWLTALKDYAAVSDSSRDAMLGGLLRLAVLRVQEMADRSLIACTLRVRDDDARRGVRLYQTVNEIVSVRDMAEGHDVPYTFDGRSILVGVKTAEVEYTTTVLESSVDELLPVVLQYATALYDGQDSKTLSNILSQCR